MRAADVDREAVAERLRVALDEGRLDLHEYDERLQQAYAAKTYATWTRCSTDLPGDAARSSRRRPPSAADRAAEPGRRTGRDRRLAAPGLGGWSPWLGRRSSWHLAVTRVSAGLHYFWPVWVAGPWRGRSPRRRLQRSPEWPTPAGSRSRRARRHAGAGDARSRVAASVRCRTTARTLADRRTASTPACPPALRWAPEPRLARA